MVEAGPRRRLYDTGVGYESGPFANGPKARAIESFQRSADPVPLSEVTLAARVPRGGKAAGSANG